MIVKIRQRDCVFSLATMSNIIKEKRWRNKKESTPSIVHFANLAR